jgi:hypothetical protein
VTWNRQLSLIVAGIYLVFAALSQSAPFAFGLVIFLPPALACIWFGEETGRDIGLAAFRPITKETPAPLVVLGGWLLLLLPAILETIKIIK